jgi:hypothetical protein
MRPGPTPDEGDAVRSKNLISNDHLRQHPDIAAAAKLISL